VERRNLGTEGPSVSLAGLGCNNFGMRIDRVASRAVVVAALDAGITFFDTARSYGGGRSEEFLGAALGSRRDEVVIATKFGSQSERGDEDSVPIGGSRAYVRRAVERSLRALGTDRIDLYQLHKPDPSTPIEETLTALQELIDEGKVLAIGHSNLSASRTAEADAVARRLGVTPFVTAQVEWSLLERGIEAEVLPSARRAGLGVLPYFPLASGLLTGKYRAGVPWPAGSRLAETDRFAGVATPENLARVERLSAWADAHGRTITELALSWLAGKPEVVSVIAGATTPAQVRSNAAATRSDLTADEVAALDVLLGG
jgi:aryl-alcohol dehydrogenase-like predicted oxidoreductase